MKLDPVGLKGKVFVGSIATELGNPVKDDTPNLAPFMADLFNKDRPKAHGADFDSMGRELLGKEKGS